MCSFNDAFSFFIRRAGTSDPLENIALIPGTTLPVTINNVNDQFNGGNNCVPQDFSNFYVANPFDTPNHRYNGSTTVFAAEKEVDPCEWYYFRMVIADVGDDQYDSAVFLEANSFTDDTDATISSQGSLGTPQNGVEGCSDASFTFNRSEEFDINQDLLIEFDISGTAQMGVDYADLPNSVTIPAGETEVVLPVDIFLDNDTEPMETILLTTTSDEFTCGCSDEPITATLVIDDYPDSIPDIEESYCEGGSFSLPDGTQVTTPGEYEVNIPRVNFPECDSLLNYIITELPIPQTEAITISELDCTSQGESFFNLVENEDNFISNNAPEFEVTYYTDAGLTNEITTPENFFSGNASVYANVINAANSASCETSQEIELNVVTADSLNGSLSSCETSFQSGEAVFDLTQVTEEITGGDSSLQVSYHETEEDAEANTPGGDNPIPDIQNYNSSGGTIFVRAESTDEFGNTCVNVGEVELEVDLKPTLIDTAIEACETENDNALFTFENVENLLQTGETISFHRTETDAENNTNPLMAPFESDSKMIWVRTANDLCSTVGTVQLNVLQEPTAPYTVLNTCQRNGLRIYDLTILQNDIENQDNQEAEFYVTEQDAQTASGEITELNHTTEQDQLFVLIRNTATGCENIEEISLTTDPVPFNHLGTEVICTGDNFLMPNGEIINEPGVYERTYLNPETNCDTRFSITINPVEVLFSSAFTPNADGMNDEFLAMPNRDCVLPIEDYELKVFNRWGELVFESSSMSEGWNGRIEDQQGMAGTYIWQATYTYEGESVEQSGTVHLIH